jgi:hypothetical protein
VRAAFRARRALKIYIGHRSGIVDVDLDLDVVPEL